MKIKNTCSGEKTVKIEELKKFQNESFKNFSDDSKAKLKQAILKHGIFLPIFIWKNKSTIIDGHHRVQVLTELKKEGYDIPEVPIYEIESKNKKDVAEKLLLINSKYAHITDEGLSEFIEEFALDIEEIKLEIDLPEVDLDFQGIDLLDDLEANSFSSEVRKGSDIFQITFVFPIEHKGSMDQFIEEHGKEEVVSHILKLLSPQNA